MRISSRSLILLLAIAAPPLCAQEAKTDSVKPAAPLKIDFEDSEVGADADDLFVIEGNFKFAKEEGGNKVLELQPSPLSESGVIFGKSLKGAAQVTAKIKAQKKRRSTPRFGIAGLSPHARPP